MKTTHLLYRSFTNTDLNPAQIERILNVSRANNQRDHVSGLLLYRARTFLQLLEGAEQDVMKCMNRIRLDTRHYGAGIILKLESDRRIFPAWSMGHIPEDKILKSFSNVEALVEALGSQSAPDRGTVVRILKTFADPAQLVAGEKAA